ncbi:MAG TPA: methylaspartate ammonia-lyase [Planctomycetota bacterium]|nr:methylaspartate ammonia-lyase [Planctomycetota bacterium]
MARIADVVCSAGATGFFFDDQKAIKSGAGGDGFFYVGAPATPGFRSIRQAGESISVLLLLDDGQVAWGDCASIQYSGAGGRDPLFLARDFIPVIERVVKPRLVGREPGAFRGLAAEVEELRDDGRRLHSAIRYGVSQALLDAAARSTRRLPCEVLAAEYGLRIEPRPVRIFAQSGDDRYANADKMILKGVDVLPHGLINNVPDKLGADGGRLLEYVRWLRERILRWRASEDYAPELHIDVYGTTGMIFGDDAARIGEYLAKLGEAARPFALRIEGPVDMGGREAQYARLLDIRSFLRVRGIPVGIVADEWCNSLEDIRAIADLGAVDMVQIKTPVLGGIQNSLESVLYCASRGVLAYLGGTCNETERSAQLCVHVALASRPHQMLAKPGMGTDEGIMVVRNEMGRALALLAARNGGRP